MTDPSRVVELRQGRDQRSGTIVTSDLPGLPKGTEVVLTPLSVNEDRHFQLTVRGEAFRARYVGEGEGNVMRFEVLRDETMNT